MTPVGILTCVLNWDPPNFSRSDPVCPKRPESRGRGWREGDVGGKRGGGGQPDLRPVFSRIHWRSQPPTSQPAARATPSKGFGCPALRKGAGALPWLRTQLFDLNQEQGPFKWNCNLVCTGVSQEKALIANGKMQRTANIKAVKSMLSLITILHMPLT